MEEMHYIEGDAVETGWLRANVARSVLLLIFVNTDGGTLLRLWRGTFDIPHIPRVI